MRCHELQGSTKRPAKKLASASTKKALIALPQSSTNSSCGVRQADCGDANESLQSNHWPGSTNEICIESDEAEVKKSTRNEVDLLLDDFVVNFCFRLSSTDFNRTEA